MAFGNKFGGKRFKSSVEVPKAPPPPKFRPKPPPPPPPPEPTPKEKLARMTAELNAANEAAGIALAPEPTPEVKPDAIAGNLRYVIETYSNDPVGFVRDVLQAQPDEWQMRVMEQVAAGARRISVRAGHGVGKSTFCAWLSIWHCVCFYPQKTVMTAPTAGQLFDALFAEIKLWINRLPAPIRALFEMTSEKVVLKAAPEASFISARTSSADRPEALAGIHSEHVLLIVDEASAVPEAVYESAAGSMSGLERSGGLGCGV